MVWIRDLWRIMAEKFKLFLLFCDRRLIEKKVDEKAAGCNVNSYFFVIGKSS